jgi:hypothetical protein
MNPPRCGNSIVRFNAKRGISYREQGDQGVNLPTLRREASRLIRIIARCCIKHWNNFSFTFMSAVLQSYMCIWI